MLIHGIRIRMRIHNTASYYNLTRTYLLPAYMADWILLPE
jgi:hypothetical protein